MDFTPDVKEALIDRRRWSVDYEKKTVNIPECVFSLLEDGVRYRSGASLRKSEDLAYYKMEVCRLEKDVALLKQKNNECIERIERLKTQNSSMRMERSANIAEAISAFIEELRDPPMTPIDLLIANEEAERGNEYAKEDIARFSKKQIQIIRLRFLHGLTLSEAGRKLGCSRENIRLNEVKTLRKLRSPARTANINQIITAILYEP